MSVARLFEAVNKQEQLSWLGTLLLVPIALCLAWALFGDPAGQAGGVGRHDEKLGWGAGVLLAAGMLWILRGRGRLADERDRQIGARSIALAFAWLAPWLIAAAKACDLEMLRGYVQSRSPAWLETWLLFCVQSSVAIACTTRAVLYWRDRR